MLAVGAALGGVVSTVFGNDTAFLVDSLSFVVSAALLTGVRRPLSEGRHGEPHERIRDATVETWRYARKDRRVRALISVKFGFGLAAGVLALLPVFAKDVFDGGDVGFGLLMASRGVGALIGPFLGHRISGRNHERLLGAIGVALAVFGFGYTAIAFAPTLWAVGLLVLTAHLGGGAQWVLSTYGLQRLVPDRIRGRIFAADYALITLSLGASSLVASWLADEVGPRPAIAMVGGLALAWAAAWWVLIRDVRRRPILQAGPVHAETPPTPAPVAID
jgi:predicted MFS family arabinose efflux permease